MTATVTGHDSKFSYKFHLSPDPLVSCLESCGQLRPRYTWSMFILRSELSRCLLKLVRILPSVRDLWDSLEMFLQLLSSILCLCAASWTENLKAGWGSHRSLILCGWGRGRWKGKFLHVPVVINRVTPLTPHLALLKDSTYSALFCKYVFPQT